MNMKTEIRQQIQSEPQKRSFHIEKREADEEARTVELAFSSEEPYERWWGTEILDHGSQSVRLGRLETGGAVLVDHNTKDHVGVVESVRIDSDRRGRAVVRFGKGARASEIFTDVVDGIRQLVSVGYMIHDMVLERQRDDGPDEYRVTDWEPFEISIVAVPADATVGVGRSKDDPREPAVVPTPTEEKTMSDKDTPKDPAPVIDITAERDKLRKEETERAAEIRSIAGMFPQLKEDAERAVQQGDSVETFRAHALKTVHDAKPLDSDNPPGAIGLEKKDLQRYSLFKAVRAAVSKDWSGAGFEQECSRAAAKTMNGDIRGFVIPWDVLAHRDLSVGSATQGANLVGTDHLAGSFIELLRVRSVTGMLGATVLDGLMGNVDIPRLDTGATFYWVAEGGDTTESNPTIGQLALSPKTISGRVDITRRLALQSSPAAEQIIRNDFAMGVGLGIDNAALNGSGSSGQPTGILNTSGIGDVPGGTNGAAVTWDHVVDMETDVSDANADVGNLAYAVNAVTRGKMKKTFIDAGSGERIWDPRAGDTPLNGYRAAVSNQLPKNLTKGSGTNLSAAIFGNWADLVIGMWGGLDVTVDETTLGDSGGIVLRVFQDIDVGVRRAASFSAMQDIITT